MSSASILFGGSSRYQINLKESESLFIYLFLVVFREAVVIKLSCKVGT